MLESLHGDGRWKFFVEDGGAAHRIGARVKGGQHVDQKSHAGMGVEMRAHFTLHLDVGLRCL